MRFVLAEDFTQNAADFTERRIGLDSGQNVRHKVLVLVLRRFFEIRQSRFNRVVVATLRHLIDRLAGFEFRQLLALLNADGSIDF